MADEQNEIITQSATQANIDESFMARALELAAKATGQTHPNPMVGAVIVKDGQIVGEGFHHKAGEAHAEVNALQQAGGSARGATLYVTLEPCAHYGKTPPCAKRVIEAGIRRVVIGVVDPNPLVAGKGIEMLRQAGIEVTTGVLTTQCAKLIEGFLTFIKTGRPFVTLKSAMSLDGKIATRTGHSQWITNETARRDGHRLRATHDAILTGIGTVLSDNPSLNCRLQIENLHQPDVVILDSLGRTPLDAKLFEQPNRSVYILVSPACEEERIEALTAKGAKVLAVDSTFNGLDIIEILKLLGKLGFTSVLVEGGSHVIASFVEAKAFNKIVTYIGNLIIGGETALSAVNGQGIDHLAEGVPLRFESACILDNNIRLEAYVAERSGSDVYRNY
ncbi:bifunctional diaminohydroxyphosphoribosylaminopyrimidine deaminase/5-amino-6-(5-phosphoribosylamino)uracil reductase RibD [Veillonella sp. R32]|uniref:bifunctional diaminohydroxyphosphoribosylaminopyrimidine deaminase/5-amino-6-(5-phosphoribosylamino)uracil reductase RibD n=1 Tax=Veillonella sp. R32 TaxID=2021312 RepID=UPI00138A30AE|nr:bifunctional diaminohydroxyphosphoribosylaminopyrimidine deaminase/5-amino-6-(5-phosphoribosylamino)uracil reductase RibD [Veillonella sp. R32]KAF1682407.1 riboflavin biosynthesis protein RibD [Veillonella sp. R32]